ncbi:MAG: hypothetical protein GEU99_20525 [Luteitalea sp.]|nr:hypothetical protein [Luteitalea sp.]
MALVAAHAKSGNDYHVDLETAPHDIVPGHPFRLQLTVRDPRTKSVVGDFAVVHEKRFHLFVVSRDLEHYDHVHPEQEEDGSWAIDLILPRAGSYKIFADFLPTGGTPQVIARPIVTTGFQTDPTSAVASLSPDPSLCDTVAGMSVALELPPRGLVAGRDETLVYHVTDARTDAPVADIEPYLGAWGHSLIVSEDMRHVAHAHPIELVREGDPAAAGGPTLTFKALLPEPGNYRIWTQIKRGGVVATAVFTVGVASAPSNGQ